MRIRSLFLLFGILLLPSLNGQEASPTPAVEEPVTTASTGEGTVRQGAPIFAKLREGGTVVAIQFLLSIVAVTYLIGSVATIRQNRIAPVGTAEKAKRLWNEDNFDALLALEKEQPSTLSRIISFIVRHRDNSASDINAACSDIGSREVASFMARAYPIAVIANILPLLGLLGTVFGMIECFDTVALAGDMGDPTLLASGISQALVTTAVGLALAIPLLFAYHQIKGTFNRQAASLEENVTDLTSSWILSSRRKQGGDSGSQSASNPNPVPQIEPSPALPSA
ncbi:MAG: MotA/TolQ/ExbB proton channel family protein [Puniceicoccaceae bacterium]